MTRRALVACANYWESPIQVGDHHLARGLVARGFDVAFISNPVSPLHLLAGSSPLRSERFRSYRTGGRRALDGRLWSYSPGALVVPHAEPLLRGRWVMDHWHRTTFPSVDRKVRQEGFGEVDLLYVREAKQAFWADRIRYQKLVFRVADRDSRFPGHNRHLRKLERRLARRADLVVYSAANLRDYVESLGARRIFHLPNGVDYSHFAGYSGMPPADLASIPAPIAVYAGSLDVWFDYELVRNLAAERPAIQFVLIGPPSAQARQLAEERANVHVLGAKPFGELPGYLRQASVGIIPFDVHRHRELVDSINPIKLYEYLACGLPVVSVAWQELETLGSPAILCRSREDFLRGLDDALKQPRLDPGRAAFAAQHDWGNRIDRLLEALQFTTSAVVG
ncbi:MAG: glycosyltransferase [Planctomycetota bacterium]